MQENWQMGLSYEWRTVLKKLDEYGQNGVNEDAFISLMGDSDVGSRNPAKAALDQMFFTHVGYYERHPLDRERIRITIKGREALVAP